MQRAVEESRREFEMVTAALEKANAQLAAMAAAQERLQQQLDSLSEALQRDGRRAVGVDPQEPPPSHLLEGADAAITCLAPLDCLVDGAWIQRALVMDGPQQARVVASQRDGESVGVKFYGVRRGSVPKLLGIKNGDLVQTIAGRPVRSPEDLLAEIQKAKGTIVVELVRKGKTMDARVRIR